MSLQDSRQQGFSLIEVLVALTVVSIGLLGIVGLQTQTQKMNSNAFYQTQAVIIAHDMAERIQANSSTPYKKQYHLTQALRLDNCRKQTGCNPQSMAQNDLFEWLQMIKQQLPQGAGVVCIDSSPSDGDANAPACDNQGRVYAIKLWWHDNATNNMQRSVSTVSSE